MDAAPAGSKGAMPSGALPSLNNTAPVAPPPLLEIVAETVTGVPYIAGFALTVSDICVVAL